MNISSKNKINFLDFKTLTEYTISVAELSNICFELNEICIEFEESRQYFFENEDYFHKKFIDVFNNTYRKKLNKANTKDISDYRKKLITFTNRLTWFQSSPFLEFLNPHYKNKNSNKNYELRVSISIIPIFLFITLAPISVKVISNLGRNELTQTIISTYFKTTAIQRIIKSFYSIDGEELIRKKDTIIDLYSHFSKIICLSIAKSSYRKHLATSNMEKNRYGEHFDHQRYLRYYEIKSIPEPNFSHHNRETLFLLNMDIFNSIANIGNTAKVPIFNLDENFKYWYKETRATEKSTKSQSSKNRYQLQTYGPLDRRARFQYLYLNNLMNWQTEYYLRFVQKLFQDIK